MGVRLDPSTRFRRSNLLATDPEMVAGVDGCGGLTRVTHPSRERSATAPLCLAEDCKSRRARWNQDARSDRKRGDDLCRLTGKVCLF